MRKLDDSASVNPTFIYIAILAVISFTTLLVAIPLEIFFNMMRPTPMRTFLSIIFPYGMAIIMFFIASFSYLSHMQKERYKDGG